ncbi:MAG TPA: multicopper oxidase CueO [Vibrio sp.]|uniref:multicopper oxidase CueO n=1 Tax=Vibrio TaxID=662 RepID=UPI00040BCAC2|nr:MULTISPECIES: multicopper oxidase CueO [Vibrio]HCH02376.1 multicopper oxidase CueO [Vibrio sp.]
MDRRRFLKLSSAAGVAGLTLPSIPIVLAKSNTGSQQSSLPIPDLIDTAEGQTQLTIQSGTSQFLKDKTTPTCGINGAFLGPVLKMRSGKEADIKVTNQLDTAMTIHWHGLEIPGNLDGGPHQLIQPNQSWQVTLPIRQPAATCWFHPHQHPTTAEYVMKGIAGMILIEDELSESLNLPSEWGADQIPLIIQDRRFKDNGEFDYELLDIVNVAMGYAGNQVLVNGAIYPQAKVNSGWVRFHLLNGSNARTYRLTASDEREFYVVASDTGLLDKPAKMAQLDMAAGERYDILVSTHDNQPFDWVTLPVKQMGMMHAPFNQPYPLLSVQTSGQKGKGELPTSMAVLPALTPSKATVKRNVVLGMPEELDRQAMQVMMARQPKMSGMAKRMDMMSTHDTSGSNGSHGMHMDHEMKHEMKGMAATETTFTKEQLLHINTINGRPFDMQRIDFNAKQGELEHWTISQGKDHMLHPFHIHGCRFRVLSINGNQPPKHLSGWKDTISVFPMGTTELLVQFNHLASKETPYMAHCHILEHEDTGMMMQFTVS